MASKEDVARVYFESLPDMGIELAVQQLTKFHLFSDLPIELRKAIWQLIFPAGRKVPIDNYTGVREFKAFRYSQPAPVTHAVNRESRAETLVHYHLSWHPCYHPRLNKKQQEMPCWINTKRDTATISFGSVEQCIMFISAFDEYDETLATELLANIPVSKEILGAITSLAIDRVDGMVDYFEEMLNRVVPGSLLPVFKGVQRLELVKPMHPFKNEGYSENYTHLEGQLAKKCLAFFAQCFEKKDADGKVIDLDTAPTIKITRQLPSSVTEEVVEGEDT